MRRWVVVGLLLGVRLASAGTVDASEFDVFWLWAGVKPQPILLKARTVYVLQGQIEASPQDEARVRFIAQRPNYPSFSHAEIWLVYRVHTLRWTPRVMDIMLAQLARSRALGHEIIGIQIDFDARTRHLSGYLDFLRRLRALLPADCQLSITGLLDWSSRINAEQVNQLNHVVDEVVVQTYQGRRTIPNYEVYLRSVARLQLPFRIGVVQSGEWRAQPDLAKSPWFLGYVVFLINE
ncbi:hypothetical protein PIN31115_04479 [Pandoraea iniqua]|uniref:DUF3142 domain-containing protein n=1 Tax=Pandoraea iniqua TaxID=2508288 RepID=A0A5E4YHB0_9BURK|nr:DUF3142 domain-containing protein [Pandoraea iniqua]VVE47688.1 hypothetical protein PIN31115_04479 [Pandoraea iniqua]